jgi:hypothetical protein
MHSSLPDDPNALRDIAFRGTPTRSTGWRTSSLLIFIVVAFGIGVVAGKFMG